MSKIRVRTDPGLMTKTQNEANRIGINGRWQAVSRDNNKPGKGAAEQFPQAVSKLQT